MIQESFIPSPLGEKAEGTTMSGIRSTFIVSLFIQPLESVTYTMYSSLELTSISGFSFIESSS